MWSIISFCFCLLLCFVTIWISGNVKTLVDDSMKSVKLCVIFILISVLLFIYSFVWFLIFITTPSKEDEYIRYIEAKSYCEILKTDIELPLSVVNDFKYDIKSINDLIDKSKKRYKHPYYSPFYYKEIANLEKLNYDTINVKIKL